MQNWILQPWPWYVSGGMIAAVMALLLFWGKALGFSSNFRTLCAACGAGRVCDFFAFDWRAQVWNLLFLAGVMLGGWLSHHYLSDGAPPAIAEATVAALGRLGFGPPAGLLPGELFSGAGLGFLLVGGLLVGFGARYAGGCTSGHAISGLANLQWPSLLAVVGFFAGGLVATHVLLPLIFG